MNNDYDDIDEIETDESYQPKMSKKEKVKSGIRFTRFLLLLIMVLAALILLFANKDKINADNFRRLAAKIDIGISSVESTDKSLISFDYDSDSVIDVYKDGIARVTSDNLAIIDNIGTQFQSVLTGFNRPALITTDKYVLTYDRGGKRLIVTNSFTVLFEKSFEDNIVCVSMNDNGWFAVVTESEAYKNKLTVYNSSFEEVYKINSMTRYILSTDISNDNKHIVVSSVYAKDENITPQLNYYKLSSEESLWNVDFEKSVAVSVVAKDDGSVAALFEWGVCILDSKGKEKYRYEFSNKMLQTFNIERGRYNTVIISESTSGDSEILVFDNNGKQVANQKTDYTALSVDMESDRLAVISFENMYIYTASGKLIMQRENPNDATHILFSDKNSFLSVGSSGVVFNVIK